MIFSRWDKNVIHEFRNERNKVQISTNIRIELLYMPASAKEKSKGALVMTEAIMQAKDDIKNARIIKIVARLWR